MEQRFDDDREVILSNQITCRKCGDTIYSAHVHDFVRCSCGAVAADGGMEYLRRVGNKQDIIEQSIVVKGAMVNACIDQVEWCERTGRNPLGVVCAIARAIRDQGYELKGSEPFTPKAA